MTNKVYKLTKSSMNTNSEDLIPPGPDWELEKLDFAGGSA